MHDINLYKFLFRKFNTIPTNHILNCHNLRQKLMKKFATLVIANIMIVNRWQYIMVSNKIIKKKMLSIW